MALLNVAAAGNAEENKNLINARFQAEALRRLRGKDCGVLDNSFYSTADATGLSRTVNANFMWPLTATNVQNIMVGRGMATAYGYDIQSEGDISFTATAPSAGTKYLFIYLEWDLSNPVEAVGSLLIHDNGSSSSWTPPSQDNLITNPLGKYQMILYRLNVSTNGTITASTTWSVYGVHTIGNPLRASHATRANDSDRADYASGRPDKTINAHFTSIYQRLDALGFKTGVATFSNAGTVMRNSLKKQGLFVVFDFLFYLTRDQTATITIPQDFRPDTAQTVYVITHFGGTTVGQNTDTITVQPNGTITIPYTNDSGWSRTWVDGHSVFWQIRDI